MAYSVVRTDKMFGPDVRTGLVSVKYMGSGSTATAIENGNVVKLNGLLVNNNVAEREVYAGVTPAANTPLAEVVLIASPEIMYPAEKKALDEFRNEAGEICRGYKFHTGDVFSVTAEALAGVSGSTAVGHVVELQAGTKMKVVASATASSTTVGKIIEIANAGRYKYYVIEVA